MWTTTMKTSSEEKKSVILENLLQTALSEEATMQAENKDVFLLIPNMRHYIIPLSQTENKDKADGYVTGMKVCILGHRLVGTATMTIM